ncbi:MAG TPA: FAD-dependent oxidoreductase [Longimicrobiales bacterium]|nr:FAD-dependent oxidoreductase [Longimicrobiales bacterium]
MAEPVTATRDAPLISVSRASTLANRTGSWKYIMPTYRDGVAPCNARCPTGVDVEGYMELLRQDRVDEAVDLLLRENPMPAVTGRVCHHPCEAACNRGHFDEAVAVHLVERELGDRALAEPPPLPATRREGRVAVVGSGPAGLACAYHLTLLGYTVTVLEAEAEAGGMLRQGIPSYRLPRTVLDRQLAWYRAMGIEIRCGERIDAAAADSLLAEYDAVFLAPGAHRGRPLGAAGEVGPGVVPGLEFLRAVNAGARPDIGRHVAIVGGGNTAMDCARTAQRLGARATVIYRRTREDMPAIASEIAEAEAEGVVFEFLANPRAFHRAHDRLIAVECDRMAQGEPDASGRRRAVVAEHGAFSMYVDTLLTAIGEDAVLDCLPSAVPVTNGTIPADELGATPATGTWAGGDAAGVERTVADALGSGKAAAMDIDRALRARRGVDVVLDAPSLRWAGGAMSMSRWRGDDPVQRTAPANDVVAFDALNPVHFTHLPRHREHPDAGQHGGAAPDGSNGGSGGYGFAEVNPGLASAEALAEARRCFNCGVCNACELCLMFCPDAAIARTADGRFSIDLDHCKGCGVCARECPRGAIVMTREGL